MTSMVEQLSWTFLMEYEIWWQLCGNCLKYPIINVVQLKIQLKTGQQLASYNWNYMASAIILIHNYAKRNSRLNLANHVGKILHQHMGSDTRGSEKTTEPSRSMFLALASCLAALHGTNRVRLLEVSVPYKRRSLVESHPIRQWQFKNPEGIYEHMNTKKWGHL